VVSYDYAFLSDRDVKEAKKLKKRETDSQETTRLLIGKDSKSKTLFAHGIPHKGVSHGSWNFERVNNDLQKLGYRRLILKSDKEPAIVAQVCEAQRIAGGVEVVEEFPTLATRNQMGK